MPDEAFDPLLHERKGVSEAETRFRRNRA